MSLIFLSGHWIILPDASSFPGFPSGSSGTSLWDFLEGQKKADTVPIRRKLGAGNKNKQTNKKVIWFRKARLSLPLPWATPFLLHHNLHWSDVDTPSEDCSVPGAQPAFPAQHSCLQGKKVVGLSSRGRKLGFPWDFVTYSATLSCQ